VRLINELNERTCTRRNALTERPAPVALNPEQSVRCSRCSTAVTRCLSSLAAIGLASCTRQKSSVWLTHKLPEASRSLRQP
jgi:hypothetical protein